MQNKKRAFTLVELMIVVAIIGILAAIAVPNFVAMQYRSKRAEAPSNVDGIKVAQAAYEASQDAYISAALAPRTTAALDKTAAAWVATSGFTTLSWGPDGAVRCNYQSAPNTTTDFTITSNCDVDNDATLATFTASKSANTTMASSNDVY